MTSADGYLKMERFISKVKRLGYLPSSQSTMVTMVNTADRRLLRAAVIRNSHVLCRLFPLFLAIQRNLRHRYLNSKLPERAGSDYIPRVLYKR